VVFVPGYGLAVAQAQHTVKELADLLEARGTKVTYGIHPVAGRMPGHMNVLLAEADVPYEQLLEMDTVNPEFRAHRRGDRGRRQRRRQPGGGAHPGQPDRRHAGAQGVGGADDDGDQALLSPGFAGIKNELFEAENTMMLFADAKEALQDLVAEMKRAAAA
jgi:H+-translocating NAD(P) transhydrogenase subunit beta